MSNMPKTFTDVVLSNFLPVFFKRDGFYQKLNTFNVMHVSQTFKPNLHAVIWRTIFIVKLNYSTKDTT